MKALCPYNIYVNIFFLKKEDEKEKITFLKIMLEILISMF